MEKVEKMAQDGYLALDLCNSIQQTYSLKIKREEAPDLEQSPLSSKESKIDPSLDQCPSKEVGLVGLSTNHHFYLNVDHLVQHLFGNSGLWL